MNRTKNWHWRISCMSIVFFVCLGLTLAAAPIFNKVQAASAVNIGAGDALTDLEALVEALPDFAFRNANNREALLNKIDAVINQIEGGAYNGAINKLKTDVLDKVTKWISASEQANLIEGIEVAIAAINNASQTTVSTLYGKVAGADAGNGSWVWKGVPYAKPPVNELRWKAPQDPDAWHGVRQSADCDVCTQAEMTQVWLPTNKVVGSEDCLYVNIYRPTTDAKNLPVYVWIHGGANVFGGAPGYDASYMASYTNIVIVVIQYRLGPLGWLYYPALNPGGSPENSSGNYGTLDTIQVLKWVGKNIAAFGGNPNNIMVGGQSAGGFNTQNLLISPLASGLFHRAFIESAGGSDVPLSKGIDLANAVIDKVLLAGGKTRAEMSDAQISAYLRGKTGNEIIRAVMDANGSIPLGSISPAVDGTVIPGTFADMISAGNYSHMPIVMGSTKYELKPFLPLYLWQGVFGFLYYGAPYAPIFATYPEIAYQYCGYYPSRSWKAAMVDSPARVLKGNQEDVYTFFFQWGGASTSGSTRDSELAFLYGAGHAMDIPFFFGWNYDVYGLSLFNSTNEPGRVALQKAMMSYLAQFAATGNPNSAGSGLLEWKKWSNDEGAPKSIIFDATGTSANISMGTWELTPAQVAGEINALPPSLKALVQAFVFF